MKHYAQYLQVEQLRREAEAAISGHRKAVKSLFHDGIPKFAEDRMEELRRHYDSERDKALTGIEEAANQLAQQARREAELAQEFPPYTILNGNDRHYVASHVPLVEADVAAMTVDELVSRLQGVLHDSSPSTRLLYWQAARKRQRELKESRRGTSSAVTPLDEPLKELDEALFGEERRRRQADPKQLAQAADEVAEMCLFGQYDAKSLYDVHVAKSGGHNRPSLKDASGYRTSTGGGSIADVNVH
jgi:hypothetical protein